jgi:signal transduction histidine kinase
MQAPRTHDDIAAAVRAVGRIEAVPTILEVLCRTTGMGFAAVARVTEERWVACGVRDEIGFGLVPGGELKIATTLCSDVRQSREVIAIDHAAKDEAYCGHPTPAMYGFESYVSAPIFLADGSFFGTLCAIDPRPANVKTPERLAMIRLFAELIGLQLDGMARLDSTEASLAAERKTAELREQFIAVLGHDLRNPLGAIIGSADMLLQRPLDGFAAQAVARIKRSGQRMSGLIEDVLDFARGRLGGGLALQLDGEKELEHTLRQVIAELRVSFPERVIDVDLAIRVPLRCDRARVAQLLSNLLGNALTHGAEREPVRVRASTSGGVFELSVANVGEPIPPAALERLFNPFFRATVRPGQQGLGLGLYISSEIARAHGGTLTVVSDPESTKFTFAMPIG